MLNKIYLFSNYNEDKIVEEKQFEHQWIFVHYKNNRTIKATLCGPNSHIVLSNSCPFWLHVSSGLRVPKGVYFIYTATSKKIDVKDYIKTINKSIVSTMITSLESGLTDVIAIRDDFSVDAD